MSQLMMSLKKVLPVFVAVIMLVGLCAALVPASTISAQAGAPPANDEAGKKPDGSPLERRFRLQQRINVEQGRALNKADRLAERIEKLIEKANEQGLDTTALVAALAQYTERLVDAREYHAQAGQILAVHAGFDANGHVVDAALARQTVQDAADAHRETRLILHQALHDLRIAVKEWREANPRPEPGKKP